MIRPAVLTSLALLASLGSCKEERRAGGERPVATSARDAAAADKGEYVLVIHGGAGAIRREDMTSELEAQYREVLTAALQAGYGILDSGGPAIDAVEAAIVVMEDSPLFNAGVGAVYTHEGTHELDASIMSGDGRAAGAVAAVTRVKNPIRAARAVLDHSPHVLLAGSGADAFAAERGLDMVEPGYFDTDRRKQQLERALEMQKIELDHGGADAGAKESALSRTEPDKFGTVGAVAVDRHGRLAAGTSTGGMTNKAYGRIGDSPIIGAGTYADENVAISCTGHGEFFIRYAVAHDVAARVRHTGAPLAVAAGAVIRELERAGGSGGLVAIDRHGNVALPFNTPGMYRGRIDRRGTATVEIYR